jgi:hypothetical protein
MTEEIPVKSDDKIELIDPHKLSLRSQLMTVLQHALRRDTYVGLDTIAAACETIAVDCRYNIWVSTVVKKSAAAEQFIELLSEYGKLVRLISAAVSKFHEDHEKNNFQIVLNKVTEKLNERIEKGIPQ